MVHWTRYYADPRDPDHVEAKVLCPNPECEGGTVPLAGPVASYRLPDWMPVGEMLCSVCDGDANCWPSDVGEWADARGIALTMDEDWVMGPQPGDEL